MSSIFPPADDLNIEECFELGVGFDIPSNGLLNTPAFIQYDDVTGLNHPSEFYNNNVDQDAMEWYSDHSVKPSTEAHTTYSNGLNVQNDTVSNALSACEPSIVRGRAPVRRSSRRATSRSSVTASSTCARELQCQASTGPPSEASAGDFDRESTRKLKKNNRERQRRQEVNEKFDELTTLLHVERKNKADKVTVLQAAVDVLQIAKCQLGRELWQKILRQASSNRQTAEERSDPGSANPSLCESFADVTMTSSDRHYHSHKRAYLSNTKDMTRNVIPRCMSTVEEEF